MKVPLNTIVIENIFPELDAGRYAIKRIINDKLTVYADVYKDGHDKVEARLKYKHIKDKSWKKVKMHEGENKRWSGEFKLEKLGFYEYTVEAYPVEIPSLVCQYDKVLEVCVDPESAAFAAWYEMWPRSQGTNENESATFDDMIKRLPEIKSMGFDVVYLTPIHPIGKTNKKGPNNSLEASPEDPGCPYSIGNEFGGHKSVEPSLGSIEDFRRFVKESNKKKMEVALDIALSCSPDHPYIKSNPEWFFYDEDGVIKYAENPPKKYEDMHHLNFFPEKDHLKMWDEMVSIFTYWASEGVTIFRVDNPHTKPVCFWQYCIRKVKEEYPQAIFLSEAFTHPKMMKMLAKVGFTQSYTYFTWRNTKWELKTYLEELTKTEMSEYFRPNFFTNTPDILPEYLQRGGRNAFKIRVALAATLTGVYGIYNGFELCENAALPGREEYINSEKYQYKVWDWDRYGNIKLFIKAMNRIRKENKALRGSNLEFIDTENDQVLAYCRAADDKENVILVIINLDPYNTQESTVYVPHNLWGIGSDENYTAMDLLSGQTFIWRGSRNYIQLNPHLEPVHIFKITKWKHYEEFPL